MVIMDYLFFFIFLMHSCQGNHMGVQMFIDHCKQGICVQKLVLNVLVLDLKLVLVIVINLFMHITHI